jgi:acetyl-CoA carboxylase biotin carboxylase subunit
MFRKILIANRGEIALRIICACKEMGIPTVAVYSQADQHSLHVRFADEAVCIGPPPSSESYLNIPAVISAAEITNTDAIHPGYGFLAESAYFAEVCEACGITFIGPSPEVIRMMGDKDGARKAMREAGLPVVPGTSKLKSPFPSALGEAERIGFPVIIKAAAGGGGKGMRIVYAPEELSDALEVAQNEALSAFGSGDVYIEKYLPVARHIEFQILADHQGNVVHLGERECSIQRRYQKLIEESPSPFVNEAMRNEIGQLAVQAARTVNYANAGTMEFVVDDQGHYYFMEMNTRIQVEHPVTEMVTGLDLVKEQIRIANREELGFTQKDIRFHGSAMECRINAECPDTFLPSPGKLITFHPPAGVGVRVDSAAYNEYVVTPYYDSLIAKIVTWGRDRQESIGRMKRALDMTVVEGVRTTIPLHQKILRDEDFRNGFFNTRFLDRWLRNTTQVSSK